MPVLAIANSKGGAGKSTTCLILATVLAEQGASVTILDCDKNLTLSTWRDKHPAPPVDIISQVTEDTILDQLDEYRMKRQFVLCDLEGAASLLMSRAISRSQLTIIPIQASAPDANQAAKAIGLVQKEERSYERRIPYRVVFTRTAADPKFASRIQREIMAQLSEARVPTFAESLHERAPYKALLHYNRTLAELDPAKVNSIPQARENAERFVAEVLEQLTVRAAA
jgi:chromosome partitioning protein